MAVCLLRTSRAKVNADQFLGSMYFPTYNHMSALSSKCLSPAFESRHEWFQHEMDNNRRQWSCILCRDSTKVFPYRNDMANHLRSLHAESVTTTQLSWLLEACDRPLPQPETLRSVTDGTQAQKPARMLSITAVMLPDIFKLFLLHLFP